MGDTGTSGVAGGIVIIGGVILVIAVVVMVAINLLSSYISKKYPKRAHTQIKQPAPLSSEVKEIEERLHPTKIK